jgi:lipase chaperone LimK
MAKESTTGQGRTGLRHAAAGAMAVALAWYFVHAAPQRLPGTEAGRAARTDVIAARPAANATGEPPPPGLPSSLTGSSAPRLPRDARGHLAPSRAVRDFFDYFLSARGDLKAGSLDALVRREISAQLQGSAAEPEAVDVWQRYDRYLAALAALPAVGDAGGKFDPVALQLTLDRRASLADQVLGEWSGPFFQDEQARQRYDLARLSIANDASLTDEQKAQRLAALAQQLPADSHTERMRRQQQRAAIEQVARLQQSDTSPGAILAQVGQTLGPQVAERVARLQRDDEAWRRRYAGYRAQLEQLDVRHLAAAERDAKTAQLRRQYFPAAGDALRASSLDRANLPALN